VLSPTSAPAMDNRAAEAIAEQLRVLGQPMRIRLLARLQQGVASVSELTESVTAGQQNVSHHLAVMHKAGILERRKVGTHVFYELADSHSVAIIETTRAALAHRSHELARLSAALSDDAH
jgi:DNA-binding transcriptional ArsR family regulator